MEYTVTVIPEIGQPRTESYRLITTLLDPDTAPAGHIARATPKDANQKPDTRT